MMKTEFKNTFLIFLFSLLLFQNCEDNYLVINAFEAESAKLKYEDKNSSDSLNVAVVSMTCSKEKSENIHRINSFISEIMESDPQTELICFGESCTGYYSGSPEYISGLAEQIPGSLTDSLAVWCQQYGIYISLGMAENFNNKVYNSLVVLNPEGEILNIHRKNTLTPEDEASGYSSMKNAQIISIKTFRLGLLICADVNGLWLTKQYILGDVDILLSAFANRMNLPDFNLISRRTDAWQIFPNRYGDEDGEEYSGLIYISDPAGNIPVHNIHEESYINYTIRK